MKAIGMISGGLDSTLAAHVMVRAGVEVELVHFESCFFGPALQHRSRYAEATAERLGIPLHTLPFSQPLIALVKDAPHGHGKHLNPCIDCHATMLKRCGELMKEIDAGFVFTGEVLAQRPFSQTRNALGTVAKTCGLGDLLVRPLSAKCLPITRPEREGWVDREKLLNLSGRSRKPQVAMAKEWGITDYPQPAGGCLLTDSGFCRRLADLIDHEGMSEADIQLLKVGRQFRLDESTRVVVARNQDDCEILERLALPTDTLLEMAEILGPLTVLRGRASERNVLAAAGLTIRYSRQSSRPLARVAVKRADGSWARTIESPPADIEKIGQWMIAKPLDIQTGAVNLREREEQ